MICLQMGIRAIPSGRQRDDARALLYANHLIHPLCPPFLVSELYTVSIFSISPTLSYTLGQRGK